MTDILNADVVSVVAIAVAFSLLVSFCSRRFFFDRSDVLETGFPFDDKDSNREDSFHDQLDDIAKRHPELAGHFEGFPFRSSRRQPEETDTFRRFSNRDRPFGSRFEQFGFPFRNSSFPEDDRRTSQSNQHDPSESSSGSTQQTHSDKPSEEAAQKPPHITERGRRPVNIHPSNTTDLGQKQEPVNERNQRSMSAPPPENRSPRFTSSINIPIQHENCGATEYHSQPSQTQQSSKPTERVIPIHVEGRDEPVLPKNIHPTFTQPTSHSYQPEPETIFGNRHNLGDFMGRSASRFPAREDVFRRQHDTPHEQAFQQQMPKQQATPKQNVPSQQPPQEQKPAPQPQQQEQQPQQQNAQQQEQTVPPQPTKPAPPTPIDQIKAIQKDVSELMAQVDQFSGLLKDKQYLYLDEMLTRNLIKLDNIDTQGQENIRSARREAIKCIEKCIGVLESKANANLAAKNETEMEVDVKKDGEVKEESKMEPQGGGTQPMESEPSNQVIEHVNDESVPIDVVPDQNQLTIPEDNREVTSEKQAGLDNNVTKPEDQKTDGSDAKPKDETLEPESKKQGEDGKMEIEAVKPTDSSCGESLETKAQATTESHSQPKQEGKGETKEKKKGKKKEKSEKK